MILRDVAGPNELDEDVNHEEPEERDARERQPDADAPETRPRQKLTESPERDRERGESRGGEADVGTLRNGVAEHQLATLACEKEDAREGRGDTGAHA
jgi:hypothetical protein